MNYQLIYDRLVARAIARPRPETYCEEHHILPRCMGGTDNKENLVTLTAREHFVAHALLVKIHSGNEKLLHALFRMSNQWVYGSIEYAWVKERWSESRKGKPGGMLGKKLSEEAKKKIAEANTGRLGTMTGKNHTAETKAKMSKSRKGVPKVGEHKNKLSALCSHRNSEMWKCLGCGKITNLGALTNHQRSTGCFGRKKAI